MECMIKERWDCNNKIDNQVSIKDLNELLGPNFTVVSSMQRALEVTLESLETTGLMVALPINAPRWVLAAIERTGNVPIALDAGECYANYHDSLLIAKKDINNLVVVFCPVATDEEYLNEVIIPDLKDNITIHINLRIPTLPTYNTTFNIFDMAPAMSSGAAIHTSFSDRFRSLQYAIEYSGDVVSPYEIKLAASRWARKDDYLAHITYINNIYGMSDLANHCYVVDTDCKYFIIQIRDAQAAKIYLQSKGIDVDTAVNNLARDYRYKVNPAVYPIAQGLHNSILMLPCSISEEEARVIIDRLMEIL